MLFGAVSGIAWLARSPIIIWVGVALAILTAMYTAFLFAQAEGRDLWQGPLLPMQMLVQSFMAGSAALLFVAVVMGNAVGADAAMIEGLVALFLAGVVGNGAITIAADLTPQKTDVAAVAARMMTHGRYAFWFRAGLLGGVLLPIALVLFGGAVPVALLLAPLLAIAGLACYEWAFVMAPQQIPNS
jgi:Ni/Fe-hydrogenase subunit HybB-like protein